MSTSTRSPSAEPAAVGGPGVSGGPDAPDPVVDLYGVRHHGPGSARALAAALDERPPALLLVEAPSDAERLIELVGRPSMRPPVAMLGYVVGEPQRASFHPFASFSPEWVAMRWAARRGVPVRFVDLPLAVTLARPGHEPGPAGSEAPPGDPLADLARLAGYDDAERWWDDADEHGGHGRTPLAAVEQFTVVAELMGELRGAREHDLVPIDPWEQRREASMRTAIRTAVGEGLGRVAVVCGAWHVPALRRALDPRLARSDRALLRGMKRAKVAVTWVPWTHRRLASATGYAAGVTAPGWYHHLFTHPGSDTVGRWFVEAAEILRRADRVVSVADVVEATRLATALGDLRERPLPGLTEVDDAARAVLSMGNDVAMRLLSNELVIGTQLGRVPPETPMVPLAADLAKAARACRLDPTADPRTLELDLRRQLDLRRSQLLHRLTVLDVPWGRLVDGRASAGTFRETWQVQWEPEWEVRLIEASGLGTTLCGAASTALVQRAGASATIVELTAALEAGFLADLADAVPEILTLLSQRSALSHDVVHLLAAVPALARTLRYGDTRGTDSAALGRLLHELVIRAVAGLQLAATGIDDDLSAQLNRLIDEVSSSAVMVGDHAAIAHLRDGLHGLAERERVHPAVQGKATRLLRDSAVYDDTTVRLRLSRALSPGTPPTAAAAFVEGFLAGSGTVLAHDAALLAVLDEWIAGLDAPAFVAALPLLRRTFGTFAPPERRRIGERLRSGAAPATRGSHVELDPERVAAALETLGHLLGVDRTEGGRR